MEHPGSAQTLQAGGCKRASSGLTPCAQTSWESILEERKRSKQCAPETSGWGEPAASLWGSLDSPTRKHIKQNFQIDFQLGSCVVRMDNGQQLTTCVPALSSLMQQEVPGFRSVNLTSMNICRSALLAALRFACAGPGANEQEEGLWHSSPRPIARASRPEEVKLVESALHCFDVLRAANIFSLPRLEETARARLLGSGSYRTLLCEASAMPLLAASFGQEKQVSRLCLQLLNRGDGGHRDKILRGRERQLGVIYATNPIVGAVLSGIFKKPPRMDTPQHSQSPTSTILLDLLLGPSRRSDSQAVQPVDSKSLRALLSSGPASVHHKGEASCPERTGLLTRKRLFE